MPATPGEVPIEVGGPKSGAHLNPEVAPPTESERPPALQPGALKLHNQFKAATPDALSAAIQHFETSSHGWNFGRNTHLPRVTRRGIVVTRLYFVSAPLSGRSNPRDAADA